MIHQAIVAITEHLPKGTNKRIHDALFAIMSGRLLETRGAIMPALTLMNLDPNAVLRTREAMAEGAWTIRGLLKRFWNWLESQGQWKPLEVRGYRVNALDTTCIYRPRLKNCQTKHYQSTAGKALPAINFGLMSAVGGIEAQKVSLPKVVVRGDEHALSEELLMKRLCEKACEFLTTQDLVVADRKFPVMVMLESGVKNIVVRRATNITLRRKYQPENQGEQPRTRGRPKSKGELIRPLARVYKGKTIQASCPDQEQSWQQQIGSGTKARIVELRAHLWRDIELVEQKTWNELQKELNKQQSWVVCVVQHPDYEVPMVILYNLELSAQEANTAMRGRWGVEQLPLVSKQLLGLHRMFVDADEMRFALPELGFLAGALLMLQAASCPPMPSGWWDSKPKPTAGRLRRELRKVDDLSVLDVPDKLCKKHSVTHQLPRGYHAAIRAVRSGVCQT
jgi:hypothetical protein